MSSNSMVPTIDDPYCQICTFPTASDACTRRLSCFTCEHCRLLMCYDCFKTHTAQLVDEYSQLQKRYSHLYDLFQTKQQSFMTFEEHCIRSVDAVFDEVLNDIQNLRKESIAYVRQRFKDTQAAISDMITNLRSLIAQSQQNWNRGGITKSIISEIDTQRRQINEIERNLNAFSLPTMQIKMSTFPRNQLDLDCQLSFSSLIPTTKYFPSYQGKTVSTKCLCVKSTEKENEEIDVNTEVEELDPILYSTKQIQTDSIIETAGTIDDDNDEFHSLKENSNDMSQSSDGEQFLSENYMLQRTIPTQYEADRIASDGEHILYFSDRVKLLCFIRYVLSSKRVNSVAKAKEITCRWPHSPILDLVYSPASGQFICATKTGVYTCTIDSNHDDSTIDIQLQLAQSCCYIRLSTDKNFLWIWTDTPRVSQLQVYSPKTFECVKKFNLNDYPRFSDNSTSFCIQTNLLATVFQYKRTAHKKTYDKNFQVTFCDSINLHELCTIRLGECDIDHEIRSNGEGTFFLTNGKKKLWIVDRHGRKEYVKLSRTGRALSVHTPNQILIANGTQQLQCVELAPNNNRNI